MKIICKPITINRRKNLIKIEVNVGMATRRRRVDNRMADSAIARASSRRKKSKKKTARRSLALLFLMLILFTVIAGSHIITSRRKLKELEVKEAKLVEQRDEQLELREELEERAVYVKTKAYVEEMAKKLGLVYPDEVIFKPEEEK